MTCTYSYSVLLYQYLYSFIFPELSGREGAPAVGNTTPWILHYEHEEGHMHVFSAHIALLMVGPADH